MQHNHIVKVDQQRLERLLSGTVHLRSGGGSGINGQFDACFMNAAHWLDGGDGTSDAPECVDPVIRGFGIRLNDAPRFASFRDELIPFTPKVLGTNVTPELTAKRRFMCIDWAIRVITPLAFEAWAEKSPKYAVTALQHAKSLRSVPRIYDLETAQVGRGVVLRAKAAAYAAVAYADAAYAAYAYAYAAAAAAYADAAYAAYAYAYAAAAAAYAAAAYAYAYAAAAVAYAAVAYADAAYAAVAYAAAAAAYADAAYAYAYAAAAAAYAAAAAAYAYAYAAAAVAYADAAYAAYAYAYAAAAAAYADAAYAAYAYAYAAAAAAYADAAYAAYAAYAAARRIWDESLRFLQELIDAQ